MNDSEQINVTEAQLRQVVRRVVREELGRQVRAAIDYRRGIVPDRPPSDAPRKRSQT